MSLIKQISFENNHNATYIEIKDYIPGDNSILINYVEQNIDKEDNVSYSTIYSNAWLTLDSGKVTLDEGEKEYLDGISPVETSTYWDIDMIKSYLDDKNIEYIDTMNRDELLELVNNQTE